MNYGEEFVKIYNKKFEEIHLSTIAKFESYYSTNYTFKKAEKLITEPLVEEICSLSKLIKNKRELFDRSHNSLKGNRDNYTYDVTISLINDEVKDAFSMHKENAEIISYSKYVVVFAEWEVIRRYFAFIDSNRKELTKKFNSRKVGDFLNVVKAKRELHSLKNLNKEIEVKKESVYNLTQNEKMILLHVLLHEFKDSGLHSLSTEYFRVLSLASDCLTEKDVQKANTNHTKYHYFFKGVNASDKPSFEKVKMIDNILIKIESLTTIGKFKQALIRYKNSK